MEAIKILVVDDDQESRDLLSEVLGSNGYSVSVVESAKAARTVLSQENGYRIVIADLQMPDGTGLDLLQELRLRTPRHDVVLMSSFIGGAERARALDLGVDALLEKPFRLTELLQVVEGLASRQSSGVPAP